MDAYLEKLTHCNPDQCTPVEKALMALWLLDNDDVAHESQDANDAASTITKWKNERVMFKPALLMAFVLGFVASYILMEVLL